MCQGVVEKSPLFAELNQRDDGKLVSWNCGRTWVWKLKSPSINIVVVVIGSLIIIFFLFYLRHVQYSLWRYLDSSALCETNYRYQVQISNRSGLAIVTWKKVDFYFTTNQSKLLHTFVRIFFLLLKFWWAAGFLT